MSKLIIFGAGALAYEVLDIARSKCTSVQVVTTDRSSPSKRFLSKLGDLFGAQASVAELDEHSLNSDTSFFVAINDINVRRSIFNRIESLGVEPCALIHQTALIDSSAKVGPGCYVGAYCSLSFDTTLHKGCVVNNHASLGHENQIGEFCNLGPHSSLTSRIIVENCCSLGAHCFVDRGVNLAAMTTIAPCTPVFRSISAVETTWSIPLSKRIR